MVPKAKICSTHQSRTQSIKKPIFYGWIQTWVKLQSQKLAKKTNNPSFYSIAFTEYLSDNQEAAERDWFQQEECCVSIIYEPLAPSRWKIMTPSQQNRSPFHTEKTPHNLDWHDLGNAQTWIGIGIIMHEHPVDLLSITREICFNSQKQKQGNGNQRKRWSPVKSTRGQRWLWLEGIKQNVQLNV